MKLHRFYVREKINKGKGVMAKTSSKDVRLIKISEERIIHQLKNVFRFKTGDRIVIFDGSGTDFECEITNADKNNFELQILNEKKVFVPQKQITLFMSVIRKENFELACEKATELGVTSICPVLTERTLPKKLNGERIEKILIEASEQCGRGDVPSFGEEVKLIDMLDGKDLLVTDFGGVPILKIPDSKFYNLLIGPEGGWSEEERKMFRDKKLKIVSLGSTVLRAETAGIVGVALLTR